MKKIRTVFLSDTHLGSKHARTDALLDFLKWVKAHEPQKVYLIGDFIDGWKLRRNWYWTKECNLIIRKIFSILKHDSEVFYVAGNHDEFLRSFFVEIAGVSFAGLSVADEFFHYTADGRKLLVIHGDKFDTAIRFAMKHTKFICYLGDIGYDFLIGMNGLVNWFRKKIGLLTNWSLSKVVKHQFKNAINYVGGFEQILADYAHERHCDGVICGHIHTPAMKIMQGVQYYNTGDWVESCSAIIEFEDGEMVMYNHFEDASSYNVIL